jgi:hypothetical protein
MSLHSPAMMQFIHDVAVAKTDEDIVSLSKRVHDLGFHSRTARASIMHSGTIAACRNALRVTVGANATHNNHIEQGLIAVLTHRTESDLHELALPALINYAVSGSQMVSKALFVYVERDPSCATRYEAARRTAGVKPKRGVLPAVKLPQESAELVYQKRMDAAETDEQRAAILVEWMAAMGEAS